MRRRFLPAAAVLAFVHASAPAVATAQIDARNLQGTWQIMTVRDVATGVVDSIAKRRTMWTHYGERYWTYIWMENGRAVTRPEALATLPDAERRRVNYAKIWNDSDQIRFWSAGGLYWLDGARMHYTNLLSIEPYQLHLGGVEVVTHVDDSTYTYRTAPNAQGVVQEYFHRRIDGLHRTAPPAGARIDPALLKGVWQIMSVKNLRTGVVDEIARKQTMWFHVSDSVWTYIVTDKDRRNVTPAELAAMPPAARRTANYAKIWNDSAQTRFWASAGKYRLVDDKLHVTRTLSIEPYMVGFSSVETVVRLDRDTYIYHSPPDAEGVIREYVHRRID
jgi:hypothetical protein